MRHVRAIGIKDAPDLRDVALRHLARFATTEKRLGEVLGRRIKRWAARAQSSGEEDEAIAAESARLHKSVPGIVSEMVRTGAVNDQSFSASRARALLRSGHSRRHAAAWLQSRGVMPQDVASGIEDAMGSAEDGGANELAAALIFARKKRLGPFTSHKIAADEREGGDSRRALAAFARAGFSHGTACQALAFSYEEAMDAILKFRHI
ncbi:hypothetical protein CGLAMM_04700 [Acetobacteraceae bacterium EV16G]|uniref:Regulatory protein RecX n=2 Tax=Sorlinia euscelidii TaxID=3081148 RepID=A0ABU7U102_9PROT